jgi:hypothetical protein
MPNLDGLSHASVMAAGPAREGSRGVVWHLLVRLKTKATRDGIQIRGDHREWCRHVSSCVLDKNRSKRIRSRYVSGGHTAEKGTPSLTASGGRRCGSPEFFLELCGTVGRIPSRRLNECPVLLLAAFWPSHLV